MFPTIPARSHQFIILTGIILIYFAIQLDENNSKQKRQDYKEIHSLIDSVDISAGNVFVPSFRQFFVDSLEYEIKIEEARQKKDISSMLQLSRSFKKWQIVLICNSTL